MLLNSCAGFCGRLMLVDFVLDLWVLVAGVFRDYVWKEVGDYCGVCIAKVSSWVELGFIVMGRVY